MSNQAFQENPSDAARALVEHLRQHPAESRGDPAALAARFGLETEFVRRALSHLPSPTERPDTTREPNRLAQGAGGLVASFKGALDRAAENPLRFEAISLLATVALGILLGQIVPNAGRPFTVGQPEFTLSLRGGLLAPVWAAVIAAQMGTFYRRGMVRYALLGGLLFAVVTGLTVMVATWVDLQATPTHSNALQEGFLVLLSGLVMLGVGFVYAAVAAVASLAGGWSQIRREEREWERLSRQELLERYFELQRRLERSVATPEEPQRWEALPLVPWVRARPFLSAALLGLGSGAFDILLRFAFGLPNAPIGTIGVLLMAKSASALALFVATAFLAGRASRGTGCGVLYGFGLSVSNLFVITNLGLGALTLPTRIAAVGATTAFYGAVGALAGLGATIQRRAVRDRRLQGNDGATLVAEMLEIQWRLEEDATSVTVLVVDAAKSTAMKVGADPLDVEYSFREYQTWIAEVCAGFGGRIHSVAGDGAVVAFADSVAAMAAARRLQTDVPRFNGALNRLPKPFRLRLGLHAGRVAGDLNDVQFTEVIDIAAHVEEIAPVGGIAATAAVVSALGADGFLPLAREVDGQSVSIALVPTEG